MFAGAWKRFLLETRSGASPVPDMSGISVCLFTMSASIIVVLYVWVYFDKEILDIIPATTAFHQLVSQPETSR